MSQIRTDPKGTQLQISSLGTGLMQKVLNVHITLSSDRQGSHATRKTGKSREYENQNSQLGSYRDFRELEMSVISLTRGPDKEA